MKQVEAIQALLSRPEGGALAIIKAVDGPSYRPVGAMMAVFGENNYVGSLSSGCVEADITLHALDAIDQGKPNVVRYGKGSKYIDIELPCGGGLEIVLLPNPDLEALAQVNLNEKLRKKCTLEIDVETGAMTVQPARDTNLLGSKLSIAIVPEVSFFVFGKGPEASTFVSLVVSAGYPAVLLSPDDETLDIGRNVGCEVKRLTSKSFPDDLNVDDRSAIILFFHDHDWEPLILSGALQTPAFYIGAQGSERARDTRISAMKETGVTNQQIARLHGPVGLIPSSRDPVTLAVSVMAEIVGKATANSSL